jgi:hypothetical protein
MYKSTVSENTSKVDSAKMIARHKSPRRDEFSACPHKFSEHAREHPDPNFLCYRLLASLKIPVGQLLGLSCSRKYGGRIAVLLWPPRPENLADGKVSTLFSRTRTLLSGDRSLGCGSSWDRLPTSRTLEPECQINKFGQP